MKVSSTAVAASVAILGLTPIAAAGGGDTLEFEDLTDGTVYYPYSSFTTEGIQINVEDWNGDSGGQIQVSNPNSAGAGNGLFTEEVVLDFEFPFPLTIVSFAYAHFGGDVRLSVNGNEVTTTDFSALDGNTVGGANVDVSNGARGSGFGLVTVTGNITSFAFGSEDGDFDDVRFLPTPGAAGLLSVAGLATLRRRRR